MGPSLMEKILNIVGWMGTFSLLLLFVLISCKVLLPHTAIYQGFNMTACIMLAMINWRRKAWQSVVVNLSFALISLFFLIMFLI